jgi:bifunctional DNA-binding transcriptional regulator/antitoxin component of YhaV-PrlF toxin-antitoxin module
VFKKEHQIMKAKVAEREQVTISMVIRDRLGIRPGPIPEFKEDHDKIVAVKTVTMDTIDQLYGNLGGGQRTDEIMLELRGN